MGEVKPILDKTINYTGLISVKGLFQTVMKELNDKDYGPYEEKHDEQVFEDGKQIIIKIVGSRSVSDMAAIKWETKLEFGKCEECVVEKDGHQVTMFKGSVAVKTEVELETSMDKTYEQSAFMYFIRVIVDKYIFKSYLSKATSRAKQDYSVFESNVKSFLNFEKIR